jgi:hypothetical protein
MSSLLVNMNTQAKMALAIPLRTALWNWIDLHPIEFYETLRSHKRMEGAPERVFDILWDSAVTEASSARALWPTLAVLSVISPERTCTDYQLVGRTALKNYGARVCILQSSFALKHLIFCCSFFNSCRKTRNRTPNFVMSRSFVFLIFAEVQHAHVQVMMWPSDSLHLTLYTIS